MCIVVVVVSLRPALVFRVPRVFAGIADRQGAVQQVLVSQVVTLYLPEAGLHGGILLSGKSEAEITVVFEHRLILVLVHVPNNEGVICEQFVEIIGVVVEVGLHEATPGSGPLMERGDFHFLKFVVLIFDN